MTGWNKCSEGLGGGNLKLMEIFKPLKEEENYLKSLVEKKKKKKICMAGWSLLPERVLHLLYSLSPQGHKGVHRDTSCPLSPRCIEQRCFPVEWAATDLQGKTKARKNTRAFPKRNLLIYTPDSLLRLYTREIKWQWLSDSPVCHLLPAKAENSHRTFYFVMCPFKWLRNTPLRLGEGSGLLKF